MIDAVTFSSARLAVLSEQENMAGGVGTLSEKMLHRVLKYCYDRDTKNHEVEVLGSIADIKNERGIIEIQTRAFANLVPKLAKFLPHYNVNVVYPIVTDKIIRYVNKEDGSISDPKKSPRHLSAYDAAMELRAISRFIGDGNLTVTLLFMRAEEYRLLDGWDKTKKKGATKLERLPTEIVGEMILKRKEDYLALLPQELPEQFSAAEYASLIKRSSRAAYHPLRLLFDLGLLTREAQGRAYIYSKIL